MSDTVWSYRDSDWSQDRDLVGYEVEADGGSIGTVVGIDHESKRIVVSMSKDQVKAAPDYDESDWADEDTRARQRERHGDYYTPFANP